MSRSQPQPGKLVASERFDWLEPDPDLPPSQPVSVHALELDAMLWRGFDRLVLPRLRALLERGPAMERAAAGWVLARWDLDKGDIEQAHAAIRTFHAHPEGMEAVSHPGPFLLAMQLCLACDDEAGAQATRQKAVAHFGELPDLALARLLLAKAVGASKGELSTILRQVHAGSGLAALSLVDRDGALFDRLQSDPVSTLPEPSGALPLVSVIVPVFNGADVLPTALRGLQRQTWPSLEILVVDDGSNDDSVAVAQAAAAGDPRIRVIALGTNHGAYPARNAAFAQARGEFVTVHDADDWSHPQKIERQARALIDDPALQATVSHWVRAGNGLEMTRWRMEEGWIYRNVSSLMLRTRLRDELGYWDRARVNADTEYYYRILHVHGPRAIREVCPGIPLAFGRTLPESLTNQSATHMRTQLHGLRHDYMEAAHCWHLGASSAGSLYLSQFPAKRPFTASPQIAIDEPKGPPAACDLLRETGLLDEDWYLRGNPDVMQSDMGAVRHYLADGARERRDPGPGFSTSGYQQRERLQASENPLLHFLQRGQPEHAAGLPVFTGKLAATMPDAARVLVFAHTSGATLFGAERSFLDMVKRLLRDGMCPVVVLPSLHNPEYMEGLLEISAAVEVLPQQWRHKLREPHDETVSAIRALIRKYRPREVQVNTLVLEAPLLAARAEAVPCTVFVRELPAEDKALCRILAMSPEILRQQLLDQADRFIMPSQTVADWLGCPDRCIVRPNLVDESLFTLPFQPKRVLKVALISSNIAKKGIRDFVQVAQIFASRMQPMRFLLIGPKTPDLLALHPFPPNLVLREYARSPEAAIEQADIVLSLSHFAESFGRTVVEAMAAGRPVICYNRGAPPSLVVDGLTGFVVPADSPKSVADVLDKLDESRDLLEEFSREARNQARKIQDMALT